MAKVSVYIPIYNVENYIERCARSLFGQSLDDIEFIFVNDCTKDKSIEILSSVLKEYPSRISQTKILHHKQNKGSAATRTTGILACTGDYIIACDSDDWVELDMYEKLYNFAIDNRADIVQCNFFHEIDEKQIVEEYDDIIDISLFLNSKPNIWITTWNKLIKRDLFKKYNILPYPNIDMYEDVGLIVRLMCYANKISTYHEALYHYNRINYKSILNDPAKYHKRLQDRIYVIKCLEQFFQTNNVKAETYLKNEKESIIKSCLDSRSYNYLRNYPELLPYFIFSRKDLPLIYRFLIGLSLIGAIWPLSFYSSFASKLP